MRMIGKWMVVKFEKPGGHQLASGLFVPGANINSGKKLVESQRLAGEWWPEIGTVLLAPANHISIRKSGETKTGKTGRQVDVYENYNPTWRVPERGDKVVFGYMDINVSELDPKGRLIVDVSKAGYVIPRDGSKPYALGEWCILEQIPRTIFNRGFVASFHQEYEHGVGVVRMAGDGFMEKHPSVSPSKVVRYMTAGNKNPECPNHIGSYLMTRISPVLVTGIDHAGISEAELERLKAESCELESVKAAITSSVKSFSSGTAVPVRPGMSESEIAEIQAHNKRIHEERGLESRELAFQAAAKQKSKKMLGSNRKYF